MEMNILKPKKFKTFVEGICEFHNDYIQCEKIKFSNGFKRTRW